MPCFISEKMTDLAVVSVKDDRKVWNFAFIGYNTGLVRALSEVVHIYFFREVK